MVSSSAASADVKRGGIRRCRRLWDIRAGVTIRHYADCRRATPHAGDPDSRFTGAPPQLPKTLRDPAAKWPDHAPQERARRPATLTRGKGSSRAAVPESDVARLPTSGPHAVTLRRSVLDHRHPSGYSGHAVATCSCSADLHLLLLAPPPSKIKREGGADGGPLALALPPHHHHALACAPRASPPPPPPPAPPRRRRPGPRPPRPRLRLIQAPVPPRPRRPPVSPPRRAPRPRRCVYVHTFPPQHLCDP
ncbi:hypothetical protein BDA96_10G260300 [Sorghum bicolor]|uniref:Uncharacterized protein n=1 Tax=Sorghum bicolor TaxID=4558 RepID=A0A921Q4J4_SORBI|nr:hypothetical protein BDA96_10G260300 [Sorghum bicolor]